MDKSMKKWNKYKKVNPDCKVCKGKGYLDKTSTFGFYSQHHYKQRCQCSNIPTKRYAKAIANTDKVVNKYIKKLVKFCDNNYYLTAD